MNPNICKKRQIQCEYNDKCIQLWTDIYADDDDSVTPAAFEEPSEYLDTAIIEMMKKIMEAVTHLMKSFERKTPELIQRHNQTLHD